MFKPISYISHGCNYAFSVVLFLFLFFFFSGYFIKIEIGSMFVCLFGFLELNNKKG